MNRLITYIISIATVLSCIACERIPLHERSTKVNLAIHVELGLDHSVDLTYPVEPESFPTEKIDGISPDCHQVLLYDKTSHELITSQIVGPEGEEIFVPVGEYDMVIFGFGSKSTQIKNINDRLCTEAFTSDITRIMSEKFMAIQMNAQTESKTSSKGYEDDPIIHEPDHLYVANVFDVSIPAFTDKNNTVNIDAESKSIIEVYSIEVLDVKGVENIKKIEAFITGQIKSYYFGVPKKNERPATLYTTLVPEKSNNMLYTFFGTFGKLSGSENLVYLDITDTGGGLYRYIYDVTDQFDDEHNKNNRLIIDGSNINIPKPEAGGGGFTPSIDDWDREDIDIPLG